MVRKVVRAGYYWPHALRDAKEFVKKCAKCQVFALVSHCLLEKLTSVMSLWPFVQWWIDLVRPLPLGK